jgi:hypothetical protein
MTPLEARGDHGSQAQNDDTGGRLEPTTWSQIPCEIAARGSQEVGGEGSRAPQGRCTPPRAEEKRNRRDDEARCVLDAAKESAELQGRLMAKGAYTGPL